MKRSMAATMLVGIVGLLVLSSPLGAAAGVRSDEASANTQPSAAAPQRLLTSITAKTLRDLLQDAGYRAEVKETATGRPMISSSTGGVKFTILLYDPTGANSRYEDFQLIAWFNDSYEGTVEDANAWNMKKRHLHAIFDKSDNSVGVAMDVTLAGGVTKEHLKEYFRLWDGMLGGFVKYLSDAH